MERAATASFLRDGRMPPRSTHPRHHQQNPLRRGRGGHTPGVSLLHHGVCGRTSSTTASVSSTTASAPAALLHHHVHRLAWGLGAGRPRRIGTAKHQVRSGRRTYFWLDWWSGRSPLRERYPNMFGCCALPFLTVHSARDGEGWRIRFRRQFGMAEMVEWDNLTREIEGYAPSEEVDGVSWSLEASGAYSARSLYVHLSHGAAVTHFKEVWSLHVPPRIKIFLWQLIRGRLPSAEKIAKR
ncbi:hypothetical protein QYE76_062614 [Lolium multiflorum]|uniref:Reverse transcriptase zinc-binding domain-containing protein n=1 Tax=Lolium multiflorum TaxID=4521 RepID=A0AAD8W8B0_LOLMU|nr:hypothetical protein QYE76_062614 [Lolium multiflorum]